MYIQIEHPFIYVNPHVLYVYASKILYFDLSAVLLHQRQHIFMYIIRYVYTCIGNTMVTGERSH